MSRSDVQIYPTEADLVGAKARVHPVHGDPIVTLGDLSILGVKLSPVLLAETLEELALELRTAAGEWEQDRSEAELAAVS